jgi:hypothetical protein
MFYAQYQIIIRPLMLNWDESPPYDKFNFENFQLIITFTNISTQSPPIIINHLFQVIDYVHYTSGNSNVLMLTSKVWWMSIVGMFV